MQMSCSCWTDSDPRPGGALLLFNPPTAGNRNEPVSRSLNSHRSLAEETRRRPEPLLQVGCRSGRGRSCGSFTPSCGDGVPALAALCPRGGSSSNSNVSALLQPRTRTCDTVRQQRPEELEPTLSPAARSGCVASALHHCHVYRPEAAGPWLCPGHMTASCS
ncbi:hypothetical protein INR49_022644 [Caranx melampygus]|nr:hypothetical protein INR49_022644 [Caranx melampygus]